MTTATVVRKLSTAQRDVLLNAVRREGRAYCHHSATKQILKDLGYIELVVELRDEKERKRFETERDKFIDDAKDLLADHKWRGAHAALEHAMRRQIALDHQVWWITEAGRAAV